MWHVLCLHQTEFWIVQSESSILMTSYSFEIMSIVFYGCPTPYMLKYKCGMYHVFMKSEFWPRPIRKKYIDDVIEFWKCVHWNPRVPKPLICLNTNVTCIMSFIFSLELVSSNQKTVFWWRHTVLKICPSYGSGPQTPWLLAKLTFSSVLNEYLFLAHFELILAHCALSIQMYVCFLSTSKVNLCFSIMRTQWLINDFRKTWYVLHEVSVPVWALSRPTYK